MIFSGDQDIDGTTENFPKHDAAMAQGPNRFARAQFYLDRGRAEAARLGVPCRWSRVVVPVDKQIRPGTLRRIITDAGLTVDQFIELLRW